MTSTQKSKIDPVTLEVIRNALPAIANEMAEVSADLGRFNRCQKIYGDRPIPPAAGMPAATRRRTCRSLCGGGASRGRRRRRGRAHGRAGAVPIRREPHHDGCHRARQRIGEDLPGGWVVYRVADNGRGIAARDHERIFELFRRSGKQDRRGEGLGLAFVRNSVRRIGGTIDIESELGKGSTFLLKFPKRLILSEPGGAL